MRLLPALVLPVLLAGCPEPVEELPATAPPVGVPGTPGPDGGAAPPPPEGAPADGTAPAAGPVGAAPTVPSDVTSRTLAALANGGPTVKIRGALKGATTAQVDFTAVGDQGGQKVPEILQIVQVTDGKFEVDAPATYEREIWVSATHDAKGDGITPDDPGGLAQAPVKLAGKDVTVEIEVGSSGAWMEKVPWANAGPPPAGPPPAGGAPGSVPTDAAGALPGPVPAEGAPPPAAPAGAPQ